MKNMEDRLASRSVAVCSLRILYVIGIVALIFALSGVITAAVAKKEAEADKAVEDLLRDGELQVDAPILAESISFKNDFTENISDDRIEFVSIGVSIRFETTTNFATSDVSAGSFDVVSSRLADFVIVHVDAWQGTCNNITTRMVSKDTIPAEFVVYKGETFAATPYFTYPVINNGQQKTGYIYISSNGNIVVLPNELNLQETWSGSCAGEETEFMYLAYV